MVYDLINAGPRRRFTVRLGDGRTIIVSNCLGIESDILRGAMRRVEAAGYEICTHNYDEIVAEAPRGAKSLERMTELMLDLPSCYAGLPLSAHGWVGKRYRKA